MSGKMESCKMAKTKWEQIYEFTIKNLSNINGFTWEDLEEKWGEKIRSQTKNALMAHSCFTYQDNLYFINSNENQNLSYSREELLTFGTTFREIAEKVLLETRQRNLTQVPIDLLHNDKDLLKKINNYCETWGCSYEEVVENIQNNNIFALRQLAKDPKKQNITEKLTSILLAVPLLSQNTTDKSIRFSENGDIIHKKDKDKCKAVDFYFNNIYFTQKYTSATGGAQDNQAGDVVTFLKFGSKQNKVGALLDGEYWDNGKRVELQENFKDNNNVIILSVNDILNGEYVINAE